MKVKITAKEVLKPALSLFVFCLIMTLLLAGTNLLTKDMIKAVSYTHLDVYKRQTNNCTKGFKTPCVQSMRAALHSGRIWIAYSPSCLIIECIK